MFLGFCALLILAVTPLLGGDLRRLAALRLRYAWVVFVALAVQVVVITVLPVHNHHGLEAFGHDLTYLGLLVVIALNWRIRGLLLLGLGAFCNGLAIAVNGGTLPASARADAIAGITNHGAGLDNSAPLTHPHLSWLGDVVATPSWLPFRNVASIGDLVILLGAAVVVWSTCGLFQASWWRRLVRRPVKTTQSAGTHPDEPAARPAQPIYIPSGDLRT